MEAKFMEEKQPVNLSDMKLGACNMKIMLSASLGQFLGQGLATLVGIIIPLLQLTEHPPLSSGVIGILGCISLIGIMVGSPIIGHLSDKYGYLLPFRLCPAICGLSALSVVIFPTVEVLVPSLFIMGCMVGGEYSLDPNYITALMPARWKVFMVGLAKALASAGSVFVAIICYVIISQKFTANIWPSLMWIVVGLCGVMFITRLWFAENPVWLIEHGKKTQAQQAVCKMLGPNVELDSMSLEPQAKGATISLGKFILQQFRRVVLTGIPWACEGLGVYGIGIFLPILVMAFGLDSDIHFSSAIGRISHSVLMTFILCVVMMIGFGVGLALLKKINHISMQIAGFVISAAGLALVLAAYLLHWHSWVAIAGFMMFELALNAGPHLITFILPSQVFSAADRGTGAGVAASVGKSGAVVGAFCIPVILHHWGAVGVLSISIIVMLLGALITRLFLPSDADQ